MAAEREKQVTSDPELESLKAALARFGLKRESPAGRMLGTRWQAHRDQVREIVPTSVLGLAQRAAEEFCPAMIRIHNAFHYNLADQSFSFDYSPDFDHSDEPVLAASFRVEADGSSQFIPIAMDPIIWPHKWLWVTDGYRGFDVKKSMQRSLWLCSLSPMNEQRKHYRRAAWLNFLDSLVEKKQ